MATSEGRVFVPRGFGWDRSIGIGDRPSLIEEIQRLPAWVDHQLGTDNLNIRKLADSGGLWRLRVGPYRAVFQPLSPNIVLHRVFRRREDTDYRSVSDICLVRSKDGLRTLVEDVEEPPPVPPSDRPVVRRAARELVANPLTIFSDQGSQKPGFPTLRSMRYGECRPSFSQIACWRDTAFTRAPSGLLRNSGRRPRDTPGNRCLSSEPL